MLNFRLGTATGLAAATAVVFLAAGANLATGQANQPTNPGDDWLAATSKLYYSTKKAGLAGFDCAVHPDWRSLFLSANNTTTLSAEAEQKVTALNAVAIVVHAHLDGTANLDWTPPAGAASSDISQLLNTMRDASTQTLGGFVQFWSPFVDGSVIPVNSKGLNMGPTADGGMRIHAADKDTDVVEIFGSDRVLKEYDVILADAETDFTPEFSQTDQGLVVTHFHAFIKPKASGAQTLEMQVGVTYSNVDGFPIPARLDIVEVGQGTFNFTFDTCSVTRQ